MLQGPGQSLDASLWLITAFTCNIGRLHYVIISLVALILSLGVEVGTTWLAEEDGLVLKVETSVSMFLRSKFWSVTPV